MLFFKLLILVGVLALAYFIVVKKILPMLSGEDEEGERRPETEETSVLRADTLVKIQEIEEKKRELEALTQDVQVSQQLRQLDEQLDREREKLATV